MIKPFESIFRDVVEPFLAPRVRKGSIKAVKGYISAVQTARKVSASAFQIGATAGALVTGLVLIVVALVGLLPITPEAMSITFLVLGVLMVSGAWFLTARGLNERRWLEMSKSHQLMEAALGEWENPIVPPDPRKILQSDEDEAARSYDENRELRDSYINSPAAPIVPPIVP